MNNERKNTLSLVAHDVYGVESDEEDNDVPIITTHGVCMNGAFQQHNAAPPDDEVAFQCDVRFRKACFANNFDERNLDLDGRATPDFPLAFQADAAKSSEFAAPIAKKLKDAVDTLPIFTTMGSPASPWSFGQLELEQAEDDCLVPEKHDGFSVNAFLSFPSHHELEQIMCVLQDALSALGPDQCQFVRDKKWSFRVSCLLVAEEFQFQIQLSQLCGLSNGQSTRYQVDFVRRMGDELMFSQLFELIRSHCSAIDDDSMPAFMASPLDAWLDTKQELVGRKYAISTSDMQLLLEEINNPYLDPETLYHVARSIKNHCRHKGNRRLLRQDENKRPLLQALQWMLEDASALARYAMFILLQFAKDQEAADSESSAAFFSTPIERSNFTLLVDACIQTDDQDDAFTKFGSRWTNQMAHQLQQSTILTK